MELLKEALTESFQSFHELSSGPVQQCVHAPARQAVQWLHLHTFCSSGYMDGMPASGSHFAEAWCRKMTSSSESGGGSMAVALEGSDVEAHESNLRTFVLDDRRGQVLVWAANERCHVDLETEEGGLEPNCALIWHDGAPPSWEDERWYARREWEKWQRQQVMAARLSSKLPAQVLHIVQAAVC
ncbi:unnamed protein product [Symbiodinium microadriaticum]|nr:unnamed protein product [Symbiodinium microadriaticum]